MDPATEEKFLDQLLEDIEKDKLDLPALPKIALDVRQSLDNPNSSLADVAKIITKDAALSARMIHIANSPLLRTSQTIETIEMAVMRMGGSMIRNMVTSMLMAQMYTTTSDITDKRLRKVWKHSTEVAAISHALATQFTDLQPDQALLAGLVHDIGVLPILSRAEEHVELLADDEALNRIIETVHCTIGGEILRRWSFPEELVLVAEEHENFSRNSEVVDYVDVVTVANLQSLIGTDHHHNETDWSNIPAFEKLGLQTDVNVVELDETNANIESARAALA